MIESRKFVLNFDSGPNNLRLTIKPSIYLKIENKKKEKKFRLAIIKIDNIDTTHAFALVILQMKKKICQAEFCQLSTISLMILFVFVHRYLYSVQIFK